MAMSFDGCMASSPAPDVYGVVERRPPGAPRLWRRRKTHRPAADPMATSKDRHMVPRRLRPRRCHRLL